MVKQFQTKAKRREVIEFELDDHLYHFTPQKVASVMLPVLDHEEQDEDDDEGGGAKLTMTQRTWDWLKAGLADGEYDVMRARLEDADDDLDVGDVADVVKWLMLQVAGRPTGSRRG